MNLIEILGNVAGGGLLGAVGAYFNARLELTRAREANQHEQAMVKLRADTATVAGEAQAFAASQSAGNADGLIGKLPAATTPAQLWLALIVEALRTTTRPLLTWGLVAAACAKPELAGMAALAVSWWFGSRPAFRFTK